MYDSKTRAGRDVEPVRGDSATGRLAQTRRLFPEESSAYPAECLEPVAPRRPGAPRRIPCSAPTKTLRENLAPSVPVGLTAGTIVGRRTHPTASSNCKVEGAARHSLARDGRTPTPPTGVRPELVGEGRGEPRRVAR